MAYTCTSLPLNLYTSVFGCGCGFGFEKKRQNDGFGEKKARSGGSLFHMYQKIFMSDLAGQFGTMPGSVLRGYSIKKNDLLILA